MSDLDDDALWIYFGGPVPEPLQPLLDAFPMLPPASSAHGQKAARRFMERLAAAPAPAAVPAAVEKRRDETLPVSSLAVGPTARSPEAPAGGVAEVPRDWRNDVPQPKPAPAAASMAIKGGTMPSGDNVIAGANAASPHMTLQQYASFRAELAVSPARSAEILARYRVPDEAAREALDEHWQKRFAEHGEERGAYLNGLATYISYLRARGM